MAQIPEAHRSSPQPFPSTRRFKALALASLLIVPSTVQGSEPGPQLAILEPIASLHAPAAPGLRTIVPDLPPGWDPGERPSAPERIHGFAAGGVELTTSRSLVNAWLLRGWSVTGGVEFPATRSLTVVPRVHALGARGTNTGNIHWVRAALDARISKNWSYQEVGLGMGLLNSPVSVYGPGFLSHREQRWSGTPFLQAVSGLRGDPDRAPAYMIELIAAVGWGVEHPGAVELVAGLEF